MEQRWGKGTVGRRVAMGAGAVALLLVGTAVLMPKVFPFARGDRSAPAVLPEFPRVANYLIIALVILMTIVAIVLRLSVASVIHPEQVRKRKPVALQILIVTGAFWLTAFVITKLTENNDLPSAPEVHEGSPAPAAGTAQGPPETSRALGVLLTAGLGVVVVAVAGGIYYLTRRDQGETSAAAAELAELLRTDIEEIRAAAEPRDAVIASYAHMERVLVGAGAQAHPADTPFEVIERALGELDVPAASARRLTELFERARFSGQATDEMMRTEAIAALEDVRAALEASDE